MKRTYLYIGIALLVLVFLLLGAYAYSNRATDASPVTSTASYLCRDGKSVQASFTADSVRLTLSDGRFFLLPQVVSGSGIRYENAGVSFIGKGDNAFIEENGTQTYVDCVANASDGDASTGGQKTFADQGSTFTFTYPVAFTVSGAGIGYSEDWMNNATTSGLTLAKATLPKSFQPNTNFSEATLTVGTSADPSAVASCLTYNPSGGPATAASKVSINGTAFTKLRASDAGAGNFYETTSFRTVRNDQCYAIEYTIHSTNIGNYSDDQGITEFDRTSVEGALNAIVESFRFTAN